MTYEQNADGRGSDRLIEEAMAELGLSYQEKPVLSLEAGEKDKKSPSEIAVERFRLEYGKQVRASSDR